jgi:tetratricopeptide (TPR) repeat protein
VLIYEALTVQQQLRDANCTANSLGYLSMLALEQGDAAAAQGLCEQSLALFEEIAKQPDIAGILVWLGAARFAAGDVQGAEDAYLNSLRIERMRIERGLASRQRTAACLESLAEVALARGQPDLATRLLGAASRVLGELVSAPLPPRLAAQRERVTAYTRHMVGEEARAAAFAAGQALSLEAAITLAMGDEDGELGADTC